MKALRTICTVLVVIGIFAWFLIPFFSAGIFASSDGVPASTLVLNSNSDYFSFLNNTWKTTALFWMPLAGIGLLVLCLILSLLDQYRWVCVFSFTGVVVLASGGKLAQGVLHGITEKMIGAGLSIGFYLMVGVFAILCGVSIIALCNAKSIWHALSLLFVGVGGAVWLTAPFLTHAMFHSKDVISACDLICANGVKALSSLKGGWQGTALYWMPLACTVLLGVCLLFILLKDSRWVCVFSSVSIVALIAGGVLASQLKLRGLYLGSGFFLMVAVFAVLLSCSILEMRDIKNKKIAENALVPEDDM